MKSFDIPLFYKSSLISQIKELRKIGDPRKKDFTPTCLDFGPVKIYLARHFGFCYGVENAIEISYKAVEDNPDKRIFLLSQMIHNPNVNHDLQSKGINFLMDTHGNTLIPFSELNSEDIVIIPAFGTTIQIEKQLAEIGVKVDKYNTTCPFVERVWKKSEKLGEGEYSVIIHGKHNHEETRATFSRSALNAPSIIVKDIKESKILGDFIHGRIELSRFDEFFKNRYSDNFNPAKDLERIGVINQTTMLASETQEIADYFKQVMVEKHGNDSIQNHFADTRDTLCYATNENQMATYGLLETDADLAIVVGGYNSSNTSHLVELCEKKFDTYFICGAEELESKDKIYHFDFHNQKRLSTTGYLKDIQPVKIIVTSGASCPDTIVEEVIDKLLSYFEGTKSKNEVLEGFKLN